MKLPRSLQWRVALSWAAFTIIALAALSIFLIILLLNRLPAGADLRPVYLLLGLCAVAAGGLAFGLGWRLMRRPSRAVRAVTTGARQLAAGQWNYRAAADASDETAELAAAFNGMADSIRATVQQLSDERNTLSAVLATMADGVIVTEPGGRVLLLNPAARELLDIQPEKTEGSRLIELVSDHEIHRLVTQCQGEQTRQQGEVAILQPRRHLSAIATPLEESSARGVLLTLHDLTRIRQVETSQKEFVSNVSHELRNPMASIKVIVETLESGALAEPEIAADFLGRMRRDVDRINNLVNDLLELSRMESGQFVIAPEPGPLLPLALAVKGQFQETAAAKGVELTVSAPEDLPLLMADGDNLSQVLVNLVENALKFTPPQGQVSITARALPDWVEVQVKDSGVGVAAQHLPHLFERFYKVDRSRRDGGTGLGLAIVKQSVEAHGGRITADSREGEGCTFTFTIPRAE